MGSLRLLQLGPADIDRITDLEKRAWEPSIQASRETVLQRFALGHHMLGAVNGDEHLAGAIAFSYIRFTPEDRVGFPGTFEAYWSQPTAADYNTVAIYSLGIEPASRELACARLLLDAAFERGRQDGCLRVIGTARIPSFAGNSQVRARPEVRKAVANYEESGRLPTDEEFLQDPVLAIYRRLTRCRFLWLLPDFLPEDEASGGWSLLVCREF